MTAPVAASYVVPEHDIAREVGNVGSVTDTPQFTALLDYLVAQSAQVTQTAETPSADFAVVSSDTLSRGNSLHAGDEMYSGNKAAFVSVQTDGNMVVYEKPSGHVLWASNTQGGSGTHLEMQGDGNLVLYDGSKVLWASNTNGGSRLLMQSDCNLVLYNSDNSVGWATNTHCSSPGPSPGPGPSPPPAPGPGTLPDVPSKPLWFGMWGSTPEVYPWSSIAWDAVTESDIEQYGGPNLRFFYDVSKFFCADNHNCQIYSDYQDRWNQAVPKLTQYLKDQKILGFFLGDEVICHNHAAGPTNTMADTVRNSFPRGKAIIWINECGSTWPAHSMPANVDWVSQDRYRSTSDEDYIGKVKDIYNNGAFQKMHSYQKAVIYPGVGHPKDNYQICDDKCTAKVELQDAKDFLAWAKSDDRVVAMAAYAWMRDGHVEKGLKQLKYNEDLIKFYSDLGRSTK